MKTLIIILMLLSTVKMQIVYSKGKKTDIHHIPALIAAILFWYNY